ncbi:hypothetical protein A7K99_11660 [Tatumella citrea]|uniref:Uncharacterized protein n=1 Tax=Tatumella citrea TaxID=53336 RepID=A0A1Y0LLB7_TATCI|nr:hypothetical protein A7K98_11665 [Tatumella citrea]ARU98409.1 hypothetical protein A7K99_11660 [Tatumella citrea]
MIQVTFFLFVLQNTSARVISLPLRDSLWANQNQARQHLPENVSIARMSLVYDIACQNDSFRSKYDRISDYHTRLSPYTCFTLL